MYEVYSRKGAGMMDNVKKISSVGESWSGYRKKHHMAEEIGRFLSCNRESYVVEWHSKLSC